MSRTRTRYNPREIGTSFLIPTGETFVYGIPSPFETVTDEVSTTQYGNMNFEVYRVTHKGGTFSGTTPLWVHTDRYVDRYNFGVFPDISFPTSDINALAARTLAETNPSTPSVDVPAYIAQLPELLDLLMSESRNLLFGAAELNVKFRFGIAPLVSDFRNLALATDEIAKRFRSLNNAKRYGSTTRKIKLGSESWSYRNSGVILNTSGQVYLTGNEEVSYTLDRWGYCKWYPDVNFPDSPTAMTDRLRQAVYGIGFSTQDLGRTAWELIPWSWLIDWFSTIGDMYDASRNIIGMTPGIPGVCDHLRCSMVNKVMYNSRPDTITYKPLEYTAEMKRRRVTVPVLAATIPLITDSQLSILGSLGGIKSRGLR